MSGTIIRAVPRLGGVMLVDGQSFELFEIQAFRRNDGSTGKLLGWRSNCPHCGAEFKTTSVLGGHSPTRRCRVHRRPGKPVSGRRGPVRVAILEPGASL